MSSSSQPEWIYDVFLSFRGEDTRASFTSHLYAALSQAGILTFKDDKGLRSGEEISASLRRAIEGSRIAIIVFSENYASSSWCLVELARIIKCSSHGTLDRVVIPVFYHVDPADVRHQTGSYSQAMERHEKRFGETDGRALCWRYALSTAANLPHFHFSDSQSRGRNIIRGMLSHKKELIVLDDVDSWSQLEVLCGSREWFGPGSVIIITTRDEDLLNNSVLKADFIYRMKEMNESESSELFSWHAFKQATPLKNFVELSQRVVAYSRGFPLTLETFGCHLFDREIEEWKSVLYKLETIPIDEIQAMLRL